MKKIDEWVKTCLHKKKLKESWADNIIKRALKDNKVLYKYYCPHCFGWHLTSKNNK